VRYLKPYKIFESKENLVDVYLSKMGTTQQDVIDIFQGVIDMGYEPKFKMVFLNKDGRSRSEKSSGQETPILLIGFKTDKTRYVGGSQRFSNVDYLENLYHNLSMFISMFKDKCHIEYDLDNYVELEVRCTFETEYDDTKAAVTKKDISDALESCRDLVPTDYTTHIDVGHKTINLKCEVNSDSLSVIADRLLDKLKASKTKKYICNEDEISTFGSDIILKLGRVLSKNLKKDIRIIEQNGRLGLYLFINNVNEQLIAKVSTNSGIYDSRRYSVNIKRGFLKVDKCEIEIESLEINIEMI
jgi:hypothetical protein